MDVVYPSDAIPASLSQSLFLAGPTPRDPQDHSWRPEALALLASAGYDGVVFNPEPRNGLFESSYDAQIEWETEALSCSDKIICWVPREMTTMPAFTTNVEFGMWVFSGKLLYGAPPAAPKNRYLDATASRAGLTVHHSLPDLLRTVLDELAPPALRTGSERKIPLDVFSSPSFQRWLQAQKNAGNELCGVSFEWSSPTPGTPFIWAIRPSVYVAKEDRVKDNELVLGRPDIVSVAAIARASKIEDCRVLLVSEFRSAVSNHAATVFELPGGSSHIALTPANAASQAIDELREETGLIVAPERLHPLATRQLAATLLSHAATVFTVDLTDSEIEQLENAERSGDTFGEAHSSEITHVHLLRLDEILDSDLADWSTIGMIYQALTANDPILDA